jgi:hypothetical protein
VINEYRFDKLMIGGSLESLLYCFINNCKLVLINDLYPLEVETVPYHNSLRLLGYNSNETIYKSELWDRLTLVLSMTGFIITPNTLSSVREIDGGLVVITEHNKRIKLFSEQIIRFDDIDKKKNTVVDWFDVRSGNNHGHTFIEDPKEKFINKIHFYTSSRVGSNKSMKDVFAVSNLTTEQAMDVNHGEGIARLKVLGMMKAAGIRGQSNGFNKSGRKNHYALRIEHTHRQLRPIYKPLHKLEELLLQEPEKEDQWSITRRLFRHKQISTLQGSFRLPANL